MISMFEASEFKNSQTEQFFQNLVKPKQIRQLPVKIAYQKFKNGKAVLTVLTRD